MYYFTVASLPFLTYDGDPPIDLERFYEACRTFLKPTDFSLLRAATLSPEAVGESMGGREAEATSSSESDLRDSETALSAEVAVSLGVREKTRSGVLAEWRRWDSAVRNELVKLRAPDRGWPPEDSLREIEYLPEAFETAREVFSQGSPADAEDALGRARWSILDRLEVGHYFDIDTLVIYHLRLQLLERKARMNDETGREEYERSYHEVRRQLTGQSRLEL